MARSYTPNEWLTEVQCVVAWVRVTNEFVMLMAI